MSVLQTLTAVMPMLFVTILVDLTLARVNLDIQAMAKIALVTYFHITNNRKSYWLKKRHFDMTSHENQAIRLTSYNIQKYIFDFE